MPRIGEPPDGALRLEVYRAILDTGKVPRIEDLVALTGATDASIREGLKRLADIHALVLDAHGEIAMAHPFSATPTAYTVVSTRASFLANCAWDALAIPAMLELDACVEARCACGCGEALALEFVSGTLKTVDAVVHFAVPPRHFYDDIRFT